MTIDYARVRALCFDLDGTLSDTDDLFVLKLARWLKIVRFALPNRDPLPLARRMVMLTETPGTFFHGIPDRMGIDGWISRAGDQLYRWGLGRSPKPFLIIPGVAEMLSHLHGRLPLSVVTARGQRSAQWFLDQFDLNRFFACVATAQTCRYTKPYPDPVLWAAQKMGVPPEACLMIGDTTVDILAGKAAGAQTVGVLCGFGEEAELRRSGAELILPVTPDLLDVLPG